MLWACAGVLALTAGLGSSEVRDLLAGASAHVTLISVLATIPGQVVASLLCGGALFVLRPGVSFRASVVSRLLRDAGANLLLVMPGLGELIGARALVLAGGRVRTAVAASALDNLAETLAQVPFALVAVVVLPGFLRRAAGKAVGALESPATISVLIVLAVAILVFIWRHGARSRIPRTRLGRSLRSQWLGWIDELHGRRVAFPAALCLHGCAWAMGGVQLWMIARSLHLALGLPAAVIVESMAYAVRGLAFFVPGGLVVQESSLVAAGAMYGLSADQSLAIAFVLRLRDVIFGMPLLVWPAFEMHRREAQVRNTSPSAGGDRRTRKRSPLVR